MHRLRTSVSKRQGFACDRTGPPWLGMLVGASALALAIGGALAGCGGDSAESTTSTAGGTGSGGSGGGGGGSAACTKRAAGSTRGAAVAITPDDSRIVSVNRDAGSVTVMEVDYKGSSPTLHKVAELKVGNEPWQVAIDGCGKHAYVVLRKDQRVVAIDDLDATPKIGTSVAVGSEPTSLALTPNNTSLYVANWVDGTLTVIDPATMKEKSTVDLNKALVASPKKYLGDVESRPSLAHPRSIAITNNGDASDDDEKVYVTEFFGQRIEPEGQNGDFDTTHEGVLYVVGVKDEKVKTVSLAPLADTGFLDHNAAQTGCYPNQLQGVSINDDFAFITAVCASPKGPLGVFQKKACTADTDCTDAGSTCDTTVGACTNECQTDTDCAANLDGATGVCTADGACKPTTADVKTTTHPVLLVVNTKTDVEVAATSANNLNKGFWDLYTSRTFADDSTRRMPLVANEVVFVPKSQVGYVSANGADAVFRFEYDAKSGAITTVGGDPGKEFINLAPASFDPVNTALKGSGPIGVAIASQHANLFTDNDLTRNVSVVDLAAQAVAGGAKPSVEVSSALPTDPEGLARASGKKFFDTGLARWSLKGQGWGSCQNCHIDGLTDNVTWYFNRGPRQSVSLDGTFASKDPTDQRILNWTAIFDEVADFENNTRGVSGGVGALVAENSVPPAITDRINVSDKVAFPPAGANGLAGSAETIDSSLSVVKDNWADVTAWIQTVRSPRAPTNLDAKLVAKGKGIFLDGNCQGCHGGAKWTISHLFYEPTNGGDATTNPNAKLLADSWEAAATTAVFPASLFPAADSANRVMRFQNGKASAFDQIQCILRPVGTFGISSPDIAVTELRQDMVTPGQGNEVDGKGFNPPSLLNLQAGAPYFHAGNARTLEESFTSIFQGHFDAIKTDQNFLAQDGSVAALVAYLLSIDEDTAIVKEPALGPSGGDFCTAP